MTHSGAPKRPSELLRERRAHNKAARHAAREAMPAKVRPEPVVHAPMRSQQRALVSGKQPGDWRALVRQYLAARGAREDRDGMSGIDRSSPIIRVGEDSRGQGIRAVASPALRYLAHDGSTEHERLSRTPPATSPWVPA